jgi:hypothetical protein
MTSVTGRASPPETSGVAAVRLRNAFTITSGRNGDGHEHHLITAPKHGPDRAQARRAIIAVLEHAQRLHHRVDFLITLGDYTLHPLDPPNGYDPGRALIQCRMSDDDPYAWLQRQLPATSLAGDTNSIIGVDISTRPVTAPRQAPPGGGSSEEHFRG